MLATVVAGGALLYVYQREAGDSLIWLGETLAGRTKASAAVPESKPVAPAETPQAPVEGNGAPEKAEAEVAPKAEPPRSEGESVASLWDAVQGGSVAAEMSLAEHFARGDGVAKNCDQARVLLKAAAGKGNREARLRLYQLESGGCQ